jgi:hypothetical protein
MAVRAGPVGEGETAWVRLGVGVRVGVAAGESVTSVVARGDAEFGSG